MNLEPLKTAIENYDAAEQKLAKELNRLHFELKEKVSFFASEEAMPEYTKENPLGFVSGPAREFLKSICD